MNLFSYQENCLLAIESDPSHSQLISMPTGTGKTITFLSAAKRKNKKCLVLVHRNELLQQTCEKSKLIGYLDHEVAVICADQKQYLKKLSIAMVPTLIRNLDRYDPNDIEMVIIDEAHHATAASYQKILSYFNVFEEKKLLLGFTATPLRGDGYCLGQIFHSHSFKMTLSEATKNGYICPVHGVRVDIKKSLQEIEMLGNDYNPEQLEKVMNCDSINNLIASKCQHLMKTPAIIFCTSVDHAQKIKDLISDKGRKVETISYKTPEKECVAILKDLKEEKLDFVTNAIKLSEGFDHPAIQSVILARPTRSPVLYKQMIGRGLRKYPGKHDCFVLEFAGNDPKMICWEDIDENCTFQSTGIKEKQDQSEAQRTYDSKFKGINIFILDVRLSPFKFYECKIRRMVKFGSFRFIPFEMGFLVAEFRPIKQSKNFAKVSLQSLSFVWMCFWKEKYKSFYQWDSGQLYESEYGWDYANLEKQVLFYAEKNGLEKWYPSEEEPISMSQKSLLVNPEKMNARKCEMFIEDSCIKKAIKKYWMEQEMTLTEADVPEDCHPTFEEVQGKLRGEYKVYELPGKY